MNLDMQDYLRELIDRQTRWNAAHCCQTTGCRSAIDFDVRGCDGCQRPFCLDHLNLMGFCAECAKEQQQV
jgi:hypothetical protein